MEEIGIAHLGPVTDKTCSEVWASSV